MQDAIWEKVILHIARMTDPVKSAGKPNLSSRTLEDAVTEPALKSKLASCAQAVLSGADFCRDWRNRQLLHRDLGLALNRGPCRWNSLLGKR